MTVDCSWKDRDRGKLIGMDELEKWHERGINVDTDSLWP